MAVDDPLANYRPVDGSTPSPGPWKIVRHPTPYATWIMSADSGCVCMGFGMSDEKLLVNARALYEAALVAVEWVERIEARRALVAVLEKIEGSE
jgi:hypothetical protein